MAEILEPMEQEQLLQLQMEDTREALTEKLEILEQKLVDTVQVATSAVNQTVDAIKDSVQDTVATVKHSVEDGVATVKDWFDVKEHVQKHPWIMFGGALAAGYCLAVFLGKRSAPSQNPSPRTAEATFVPEHQDEPQSDGESPESSPTTPGYLSQEIDKMKSVGLGVLLGAARDLLLSSMPEHIGHQVREVVDSVTRKAGGQPMPSSDWAHQSETTAV